MSKPSQEIMKMAKQLAKADSGNAGGWEAIEDMATLRLMNDPMPYILSAVLDYLDLTAPITEPIKEELE